MIPHDFLTEWMEDFEKLGDALSRETSYVASLARRGWEEWESRASRRGSRHRADKRAGGVL